jgi:hypothetical protein
MTRMFQSAINHICVNVSITGNFTKSSAPVSMQEFQIMKVFSIKLHPPNVPRIMEVYWYSPNAYGIKCNTDGIASLTSLNSLVELY